MTDKTPKAPLADPNEKPSTDKTSAEKTAHERAVAAREKADKSEKPDPKSALKFWIVKGSTKPARSMRTVEECLKIEAPKPPEEVTADDLLKIPFGVEFMQFATEKDAWIYIEERKRELVLRAAKIKRAQDKTARERAAFRGKNPKVMRAVDRRAAEAMEESRESVRKAQAARAKRTRENDEGDGDRRVGDEDDED